MFASGPDGTATGSGMLARRAVRENHSVATTPGKKRRIGIAAGLLVLMLVAAVAGWRVPIPTKVPSVAWNSPWVFRAEVFVGLFIVAYLLLAIIITTVLTGRAPAKLSFGLVSYEEAEEKTVDALGESRTALRAVQREVDGLRRQMRDVLASSRAAHEGLIALPGNGHEIEAVRARSRDHIAALGRADATTPEAEPEFDEAMAKLERTLAELDAMLARPRGVSRAS